MAVPEGKLSISDLADAKTALAAKIPDALAIANVNVAAVDIDGTVRVTFQSSDPVDVQALVTWLQSLLP